MEFKFGMAGELSADLTAVAFCGTVLFLNVFDGLTKWLERSVGTSRIYSSMIQRIYYELMSTGFVSVMLSFYKATANHSDKRDRAFTTLDFCGYFIFCVSIFHVMHGIYIIIISLSSAKQYDESHRNSVSSILKEWTQLYKQHTCVSKLKAYLMTFLYIPGFALRSKAEFKIFYSLFRHTYMLPTNFHYGKYLSGCLERYSLKIVTIGATGWICMILICLSNLLRVKFGNLNTWKCDGFETSGYNDGEDQDVEVDDDEFVRPRLSNRCQRIQLQLFFGCGLIINAFVLLIYVLGRMYTLRLLAIAGVTELNDFEAYLTLEEKIKAEKQKVLEETDGVGATSSKKTVHRQTINMETFKSNFEKRKSTDKVNWSPRSPSLENIFSSAKQSVLLKLGPTGQKHNNSHQKSDGAVNNAVTTEEETPVNRRTALVDRRPTKLTKKNNRGSMINNRNSTIGRVGRMAQSDVSVSKSCIDQYRSMKLRASFEGIKNTNKSNKKLKGMFRSRSLRSTSVQPSGDLKYSEDFSFIYVFGSPLLYFRAVEICIVLNSLYLSFWVLNFITTAHVMTNGEGDHWPGYVWQPILIGPLLFSIPAIGEIVKTASLLTAISELEIDVMGLIIEGMERKKSLSDDLKKSICEGFQNTFQQECTAESFQTLFDAHDTRDQQLLDYCQVRNLLINLNQHISDERFGSLMEILDFNRDSQVSFKEFRRFLFDNQAQASPNDSNTQKESGRKVEPEQMIGTDGTILTKKMNCKSDSNMCLAPNTTTNQVYPLSGISEQEDEKIDNNNTLGHSKDDDEVFEMKKIAK